MNGGEIWLVGLDPALAHEQKGVAGSHRLTTRVAHCDRPRALDLGARRGRKLEAIPERIVNDALARLLAIFE